MSYEDKSKSNIHNFFIWNISYSHIFSPFLDIVTLSLEKLHVGRSESQSIGGKMIRRAVAAIA
jgi:hypothetical protein